MARPFTAHTETIEGQHTVALLVEPKGLFTVVYGEQRRTGLTYAAAAKEYGECLMHSLQCAGQLEAA